MTNETNQNEPNQEAAIPYGLTIRPSGVQTYTDTRRGKSFLTLFFRKRGTSQSQAPSFAGKVLDDLSAANISLRGAVKAEYVKKPDGVYDCALEIPVENV